MIYERILTPSELAGHAFAATQAGGTPVPVQPCAMLTGLMLPGSDTATVNAQEVAGSGCQVAIEITDTSDPRGGLPGMIGIDLTLPDSWDGNYMAEGNGVYCSPANFVTLSGDNQVLAANGGIRDTEQFMRYFLAPGVGHCGAPGPGSVAPSNPMQQVIDWVTRGQAPAVLNASGSINGQPVTRPLCPYPDPDAIYTAGGSPHHGQQLHLQQPAAYHQPIPAGRPARCPEVSAVS